MKAKNVKLIAAHIEKSMVFGVGLYSENRKGYQMALRDTAENLATILKLDNPKFDRDKFIKECGL